MKLYLITLTISLLALYTFIKRSYKYASVQDEVDCSQKGIYKHYHVDAPIDYEETQAYKNNEPWFTGMGRC